MFESLSQTLRRFGGVQGSGSLLIFFPVVMISNLPTELVLEILAYALSQHATPSCILRVNKAFLTAGEPMLYSNLHFDSTLKLSQFAQQRFGVDRLPPPRSLHVTLAGGATALYVFQYIRDALRRCCDWSPEYDQTPLNVLSLCLHSHSNNPELELIYDSLSLAK